MPWITRYYSNHSNHILLFLWPDSPQWGTASSFTRFLDHTKRRITVGRTPLDEWSATTDTDWGVCRWPWQLFALGKAECRWFVKSNRCIPAKNTFGWSTVAFSVFDNTVILRGVVLCGYRYAQIWRQACHKRKKSTSCSETDSYLFYRFCIFPLPSSWVERDCTH
jgi:hypothetical protein